MDHSSTVRADTDANIPDIRCIATAQLAGTFGVRDGAPADGAVTASSLG